MNSAVSSRESGAPSFERKAKKRLIRAIYWVNQAGDKYPILGIDCLQLTRYHPLISSLLGTFLAL